jgi:hypothetical protein
LSKAKTIIDEKHQQPVSEVVGEGLACTGSALAVTASANESFFALYFQLEVGLLKERKEFLKGMQVHASKREEKFRVASEFVIEVHH